MHELKEDKFYEVIKDYKDCVIDYCLVHDCKQYNGKESHKEIVVYAMGKYVGKDLYDVSLMRGKAVTADSFLYVPQVLDDKLYDSIFCANGYLKRGEGGKIPYWYAFLEPPNKNSYGRDDFIKVNKALFPNGASSLEVFEWSTDWSEYFSEGHEWWGTACYSVYDKVNKRFVVVLASATD